MKQSTERRPCADTARSNDRIRMVSAAQRARVRGGTSLGITVLEVAPTPSIMQIQHNETLIWR